MLWVRTEKWCEETGDTMDDIRLRCETGKWLEGQQCKTVEDHLWVNVKSAIEWIEQWPQNKDSIVE